MIQFLRKWFANNDRHSVKVINALVLAFVLDIWFGVLFYITESPVQEGLTLQDSIWWAMVTMTTVGYGDYYAQTFVGRFLVSYPCFIFGIGIIGYLLGTVADGVMERVSLKKKGLMNLNLKDHIVICHCPNLDKVLQLAFEFRARMDTGDTPMVVITETLKEAPREFSKQNIKFVRGAAISEESLERANVKEAMGALVLARHPGDPRSDAESFAVATLIAQIAKEAGREIKTVVELVSRNNEKLMDRVKTEGVVASEGLADRLLVHELLSPGCHQIFEELITNVHGCEFYTVESKLEDVSILESQIAILKHPANVQLVGLLRNGEPLINPSADTKILKEDRLIVLAEDSETFGKIEDEILQALKSK